MKITLNNVRISFPSLFHKAVFNGEETKYEATFLINKQSQADLIEKLEDAVREKIKVDLKGAKLGADKICFKDGEDIDYEGYAGHMSIKASSNRRPLVIDRDRSPITEDDNVIYAGCYVNAIIELWAQNNNWGKRINANLMGVQFVKDGEAFGDSQVASVSDFDIVEGGDDDFEDDIPF